MISFGAVDPASFTRLACLEHTEPEFRQALFALGTELDIDPDYLAGVMAFESGFNPAARNPLSDASGLIQFMPGTAKRLGTTTAALRKMSRIEQLPYVGAFFKPYRGKIKAPEDAYLATFYPCAIGKDPEWVVASATRSEDWCGESAERNRKVYSQNAKAFDKAKRGFFTKGDVARAFLALYQPSLAKPRLGMDEPQIEVGEGCRHWYGGRAGGSAKDGPHLQQAGWSPDGTQRAMIGAAFACFGFIAFDWLFPGNRNNERRSRTRR